MVIRTTLRARVVGAAASRLHPAANTLKQPQSTQRALSKALSAVFANAAVAFVVNDALRVRQVASRPPVFRDRRPGWRARGGIRRRPARSVPIAGARYRDSS